MTLNPILKVLSTFRKYKVKSLLIGGQACIIYGAAEFSRDSDFVILCDDENLNYLNEALKALKAELMQKGVSREIIDDALENTESESELEKAKKILEKRMNRYTNLDPQEAKKKMLAFLGSRGFSYDIAKSAIDELAEKE